MLKFHNNFYNKKNSNINFKPEYKIERFGSHDTRKVTVVSHYFHLKQSKHSTREYTKWLRKFLLSVTSPLVLFTDKHASIHDVLVLRNLFQYPTTLYITDNIWFIMRDLELERNRNYTWNYKNVQLKLDSESHIHTPDLYALWNLKTFMVDKIAKENYYKSSTFIYTDSGAWRDQVIKNWPDETFVDKLNHLSRGRILLGQLREKTSKSEGKIVFPYFDLIEGTFFMGSKEAVSYFKEEFWRIHDERFDRGEFVGKDQILMNVFAFNNQNASLKLEIWKRDCYLECNLCNVDWFFYQRYLASNEYYYKNCIRNKDSLLAI